MPPSAVFLLAVILIAAVLLIATRIRADLVALLTLVALALSGLVTPAEAFAGFSSSAVMTILAIFIISEAMSSGSPASWPATSRITASRWPCGAYWRCSTTRAS